MHADGRGAGRPRGDRHIGDVVAEVETVGSDTAAGAAVGGPWGAAAGFLYGVADQFGSDIVHALNPNIFSEDDYKRMRQACVASGGTPTPGVAPDNYGGCTYASINAVSGGDHPFPGTWNGQIKNADAYARAGGADAPDAPHFCEGPFGIPIPCAGVPSVLAPPRPVMHASLIAKNEAAREDIIRRAAGLLPKPVVRASKAGGAGDIFARLMAAKNDAPPTAENVRGGAPRDVLKPSVSVAVVAGGVSALGAIGGAAWWFLRKPRR